MSCSPRNTAELDCYNNLINLFTFYGGYDIFQLMSTPEQGSKNQDSSLIPIIDSQPDGSMEIKVDEMVPYVPYFFLYRGEVPAVGISKANGSVRLLRVFEPTRNPLRILVNKLREPIITTPPLASHRH